MMGSRKADAAVDLKLRYRRAVSFAIVHVAGRRLLSAIAHHYDELAQPAVAVSRYHAEPWWMVPLHLPRVGQWYRCFTDLANQRFVQTSLSAQGRHGQVGDCMELRHIRYFLALLEEQNFTRAAKRCRVAQPSVTNAIHRLERHVGGKL